MENASKALLMAASVLVGVLIISLGVYLFSIFGNFGAQTTAQLEQKQIDEFNVQFYKYEGQENCRIHDVITIANLAKQNNQNYGYTKENEGPYYIAVVLKKVTGVSNSTHMENNDNEVYTDLIKKYAYNEDQKKPYYFKCDSVEINKDTKIVNKITFSLIN